MRCGSDFTSLVKAFLKILYPVKKQLEAIRKDVQRIEIVCQIGLDNNIPMAWNTLPSKLLQQLGELGIDLQLSVMRDAEPDNEDKGKPLG